MALLTHLVCGSQWICTVDAAPVFAAPVGSIAMLNTAPGTLWRATDAAGAWVLAGIHNTQKNWTTATLLGDGSSPADGDYTIDLASGDHAVIIQAFARRASGTGANPSVAIGVYPDAARAGTPVWVMGSAFAGEPLGVGGPPGAWSAGCYASFGGSNSGAPVPTWDSDGTGKIHVRVLNTSFGLTPGDDLTADVRLLYYESPVDLT